MGVRNSILLLLGTFLFLTSCNNRKTAKVYLKKGQQEYDSSHFKEAVSWYNKALLEDPDFWKIYTYRAKAKLALMDYHGSIHDCEKAIKNLPIFKADAYLTRGIAYQRLLRFYEAKNDLDRALRMSEDANFCARALSEIGQVHMLKAEINNKDTKKQITENLLALGCFDQSISLNSNVPMTFRRRAFAKLKLKVRGNLTDGGKSDFKKAQEGGINCNFELKTYYFTGRF